MTFLHLRKRAFLLLALFLATFFSFNPTAKAAYVGPVPAFVGVTTGQQTYSNPPQSFSAQVNFTWILSPDDPNQAAGALNYSIWLNTSQASSGWVCLRGCLNSSGVYQPVPGHSGWVYIVADVTAPLNGGLGPNTVYDMANGGTVQTNIFTFNITAQTGSNASPASCVFSVNVQIAGSQGQCGAPILQPPSGIAALVNATSTTQSPGNVNLSWSLSPSDANQTIGNLTYRLLGQEKQSDGTLATLFNLTIPPGSDPPGVRHYDEMTFGGQQFILLSQARAEDPFTHQVSNYTCQVSINTGTITQSNVCGAVPIPTSGANGIANSPQFPMLNLAAWSTSTGLSTSLAGWFLGFVLILVCLGFGWYIGRIPGTILGATLGIGFAGVLDLIPLWFILLAVVAGAAMLVLGWKGGSSA